MEEGERKKIRVISLSRARKVLVIVRQKSWRDRLVAKLGKK